jgi:FkbM family methyltransferase
MSIKGNIVRTLSNAAVASPCRPLAEKLLTAAGHKFPTSRTVHSFCRHFGTKLMEHEGQSFERVATLASGGRMYCGLDGSIGLLNLMHYFMGTITGQTEDESPIVSLVTDLVRKGDVFFDVGANFGFYSCFVSPLIGSTGSVHAFEANPRLIPILSRSLELNRKQSTIQLNAVAVGRQSNTHLPFYGVDRIGSSSLHAHGWLDREKAVLVPVITIDDYVRKNNINRIDVMKIDIEGAELEAFQGMETTFRICPPGAIICELMPISVSKRAQTAATPSQIARFLETKGYEMFQVIESDSRLTLRKIPASHLESSLSVTNVIFVRPGTREQRLGSYVD